MQGSMGGRRRWTRRVAASWILLAASILPCGCTTIEDYVHNGFKVGPQYKRPEAPAAPTWINAADQRVRSEDADISHWWTAFNDPTLDELVQTAYHQNLTLREAGFRILQARAELGIAVGELFPQTQTMNGGATSHGVSVNVANRIATPTRWFGQFDYGFNMAWEIDFWGRYRRAIESKEDTLNASVENYDDVIVTLVGDVAKTYVQIRILQQQIAYAKQTLGLQRESLSLATAKFEGGNVSKIDVEEGESDVATTEATIEQLNISLRVATNSLCVLMGMPPEDLIKKIGDKPIPTAPPEVIIGIPADLMRRRPDLRQAERLAAAQCAMIGVATADFYPQISLNASFGWSAQQLKDLFAYGSFRELVGPSFQWPILNYGRIVNNVKEQDAKFQELVVSYQGKALKAGEEVEDGLVTFLRAHARTVAARRAVVAETAALKESIIRYRNGLIDYTRVVLIQERLVERQLTLAEAEGQIAQGLIMVYRALGGGWEIRLQPEPMGPPSPEIQPQALPAPAEKSPEPKKETALPQILEQTALKVELPVATKPETPELREDGWESIGEGKAK